MNIAGRFLLDRRRSFLWWSLGMVVSVCLTVALWPSVRGEQQFEDLLRDLPTSVRALIGSQEGIAFTAPPGYLQNRLLSTLFPLLLLVFGIGLGARAVGGAEEDGTLELVLAQPVTRARLAAERYAATVTLVVALAVVGLVSLLALGPTVGLLAGWRPARLALAGLALVGLALLHATIAFAVGCAVGRRGPALGVAGAVAVGGYVLNGLIAATDATGPARQVSPWHWYLSHNLLVQPPDLQATGLPFIVAAVVVGAGAWAFVRRDLRLP